MSISDRRLLVLSSGPAENLVTRLLREQLDEQALVILKQQTAGFLLDQDPRPLRELAERLAATSTRSAEEALMELKRLERPLATYAERVPVPTAMSALGYPSPCTEAGAPICKGCRKREAVARGLCGHCMPPNHRRKKR
jgi:hypothetical protein